MCFLFCDVDEQGKIVSSIIGDKLIELQKYDYTFELEANVNEVVANISEYRVIDGKLMIVS